MFWKKKLEIELEDRSVAEVGIEEIEKGKTEKGKEREKRT